MRTDTCAQCFVRGEEANANEAGNDSRCVALRHAQPMRCQTADSNSVHSGALCAPGSPGKEQYNQVNRRRRGG